MTKMSDVAVPSLLITEGTEPTAPAAGKQRLYIDSTSHVVMITNSSGAESVVGTGLIWTKGTSMPGSPVTNQRITRTDLGMDFYYDGTRWLSTQVYFLELKIEDVGLTWPPTVNTTPVHRGTIPFGDDYDYYLLDWHFLSSVLTTNNGTNYWTPALWKFDSTGGGDSSIASTTTAADTAGNAYNKKVAINALLGAFEAVYTVTNKTLSPGAHRFHGGHVTCRVVGT